MNDIGVIASLRVIGLATHLLLSNALIGQRALEHLHCDVTMGQQSKHGSTGDFSRSTCHVYERKFDTKTQSKRDKNM